jgi:hypothetical protein
LAGKRASQRRFYAGARDRVAHWLETAAVQETRGAGLGGIAGHLDATGRPAFLYGEATGYWLRWASLYAPNPVRMAAAVEFFARQWSGASPPPTRFGATADWRNGAVFSFDLAITAQGLADAASVVGETKCAKVVARLVPWLEQMISPDETLLSHLALETSRLPDRWSTRPGPYQAKTASAILRVPEHWLSPALAASARRTLARWKGKAEGHLELHARFYAIEGLLRGGEPPDSSAILAVMDAEGGFPERIGSPDSRPRADVQAQALRLLCLSPGLDESALDAVAAALCRHINHDGSVSFRIGGSDANVWCAQFTYQALDWMCERCGDGCRGPPDTDALI